MAAKTLTWNDEVEADAEEICEGMEAKGKCVYKAGPFDIIHYERKHYSLSVAGKLRNMKITRGQAELLIAMWLANTQIKSRINGQDWEDYFSSTAIREVDEMYRQKEAERHVGPFVLSFKHGIFTIKSTPYDRGYRISQGEAESLIAMAEAYKASFDERCRADAAPSG